MNKFDACRVLANVLAKGESGIGNSQFRNLVRVAVFVIGRCDDENTLRRRDSRE